MGIVPAFDEKGKVDEAAQRRHIRWLVDDCKVHGIAPVEAPENLRHLKRAGTKAGCCHHRGRSKETTSGHCRFGILCYKRSDRVLTMLPGQGCGWGYDRSFLLWQFEFRKNYMYIIPRLGPTSLHSV